MTRRAASPGAFAHREPARRAENEAAANAAYDRYTEAEHVAIMARFQDPSADSLPKLHGDAS